MDPLTPIAFSSAGVIQIASPEERLSEGKGGSLRCHHTFQISSCLYECPHGCGCVQVCVHAHMRGGPTLTLGGSPSLTLYIEAWSFIEFRVANIAGLANHLAPMILSLLPKC